MNTTRSTTTVATVIGPFTAVFFFIASALMGPFAAVPIALVVGLMTGMIYPQSDDGPIQLSVFAGTVVGALLGLITWWGIHSPTWFWVGVTAAAYLVATWLGKKRIRKSVTYR